MSDAGDTGRVSYNLLSEAGVQREDVVRRSRERVRTAIILSLFLIFGGTVFYAFIRTGSRSWSNAKELLDLILPAETALLGTAVAFYMIDVPS